MTIRFSKDITSGVSHLSGATISFSSKPRSLARYVKNKSVLKRHRKQANRQGFGGALAEPLEFEIYKGKTTRLIERLLVEVRGQLLVGYWCIDVVGGRVERLVVRTLEVLH